MATASGIFPRGRWAGPGRFSGGDNSTASLLAEIGTGTLGSECDSGGCGIPAGILQLPGTFGSRRQAGHPGFLGVLDALGSPTGAGFPGIGPLDDTIVGSAAIGAGQAGGDGDRQR
jgi:hypothetical protein